MTISTIYEPTAFDITAGTQTVFPFNWDVIKEDDVFCLIDGVLVSPGDFTVVLNGSPPLYDGGTVTFTVAPTGNALAVARNTDRTQEIDYTEYDPFPAETHEFGLDKLTMLVQEIYANEPPA
jgi:hypothetical protein